MGEKVEAGSFDLADRHAFRRKLQQCRRALERMLDEKRFDRPKNLLGLEIELNLAGSDGLPRMMNQQVLERIASRDFQTELGMFNLEVNIAPIDWATASWTGWPRSCGSASGMPTAKRASWTPGSS